jgi:DNA mismatch repair ATPase MutS
VLRILLRTGCIGAVTTHDLALAELTRMPQSTLRAVHFQDVLEGGRMRFDYRLREGVVRTTNALRVLALAGIPIGGEAQAEEG